MRPIRKLMKLSKDEYYKKHLLIINPLLPQQVTPKEAEVLGAFMALEGDISKDPFGTTGRKQVRERLNLSPGGLGNHLRVLKEKEFIVEKDNKLQLLSYLIPAKDGQLYEFKLQITDGL